MSESTPFHDHEVHVREFPLPGNARLFSMTLTNSTVVTLSTSSESTDQTLAKTPSDSDGSVTTVRINAPESTILAALPSGICFVIEQPEEHQPVDADNLRTMPLPAGAPAVRRRLHDCDVPDSIHSQVIAVIRDDALAP